MQELLSDMCMATVIWMKLFFLETFQKYKEGNNHPSSVIQTPPVHNHDKAENKCHTQDNTGHLGKLFSRISVILSMTFVPGYLCQCFMVLWYSAWIEYMYIECAGSFPYDFLIHICLSFNCSNPGDKEVIYYSIKPPNFYLHF